ncbi:MAG: carboxylating nicotinate-nucleotide diphosphorylase [Candidatus Omnitrophica bacterium]|nr:carboxylating nicotinate-nucleotide diphosphorylase [Candidatus Omnitrophota bacterium]
MLKKEKILDVIKRALEEDIGRIDLTTSFLIPPGEKIKADIIAKSEGIVAGLPIVEAVYGFLDADLRVKLNIGEGSEIEHGKAVCYIEGKASSVLKGERLVLNFLNRLSGIATLTKRFVDKAAPYKVDIFDTRKTTPNLRYFEKYAVKIGGGKNHRMGLYDQVLIKDNHLAIIERLKKTKGSSVVEDSVKAAKNKAQKNIKIEVEVKNIAEFQDALSSGADIIMLDNMKPDMIKEAIKIRDSGGSKGKRAVIEVSGNINLNNIEEYAKTGVDRISIGALTHSPAIIDFSLNVI